MAVVTRHEKPVAYVVSAERMDALLETIELLANPKFSSALKRYKAGKMRFTSIDALPG